MSNLEVRKIKPFETHEWLLYKHYAKRLCSISHAFGLYAGGELIGICTFGVPSSSTLRAGICGVGYKDNVFELNRLCINEGAPKNSASVLVGGSLRMIPKGSVIVSYADISHGHIGYVYQATNWIYTGLSAKRTDWKIKGMEHLHGQTIADMSRGQTDRAAYMRERFGDDFYLKERPRKHRYVYFVGSKKQKKQMIKALQYQVWSYPKGDNARYDASYEPKIQGILI